MVVVVVVVVLRRYVHYVGALIHLAYITSKQQQLSPLPLPSDLIQLLILVVVTSHLPIRWSQPMATMVVYSSKLWPFMMPSV